MTEPNFSAIRARLRYESVDEFIDGYSRYVTAGGMFIPMMPAKLKPVGTTVRFQFVLGDGATALLGEGIVRQIRGLESEDADSPIGMLVKFTKLSQDSKVLIDRIVALKEVEKLGVDLLSDENDAANFSNSDAIESGVQEATTGSYSLADLAHSSVRAGIEDSDEDLGALFTDRTGRLQASELAGLGASTYGEKPAESVVEDEDIHEDIHDDALAESQSMTAHPSQDWGPESEEIGTAGSGELSLDLFGFDADDFEAPESEQVFSKEDASADADFHFELELSEPEFDAQEPVAGDSLVFDGGEEQDEQDLMDFPAFSLSEVSADAAAEDASQEVVAEEQLKIAGEEDAADAVEDDTIAPRVVRETRGGLQIHSFDGSADEAVDRDFEQFALGSEDDVDSMFDDVFGSAFGGAFGDSDDEDENAEDAVEFAASQAEEEEEVEVKSEVGEAHGALDEIAAEIEAMEDAGMLDEPALLQPVSMPPAAPLEVSPSDAEVEESSEDSLAALLFGEESESVSADGFIVEEAAEAAPEALELESLLADPSAPEFVEEIESEEAIGLVESSASEDSFSFIVDEDVSEETVDQVPPLPPVPDSEPELASVADAVEEKQEADPSELLSLLGALEDSGAEDDGGLSLGEGLSLSHGLNVPSSPEVDDEPDSLSALLANAQKELEAKSAVSEEDRQRDVLDELLGDDDLPLPPVVNSPFAVPEIIVEKKRKGFISKLFGKD